MITDLRYRYSYISRINWWTVIVWGGAGSNKYIVFTINGTIITNWGLLTCPGIPFG